jgi:hypothetical protein
MTLNFGCTPSEQRAQFAEPPRVVYVGNLSASFNDTPLLIRLAALYPHIDVYGGPPPDSGLGLNYLGYAPSLDVLSQYQLGLVTVTKDPLRRDGFSSKHLGTSPTACPSGTGLAALSRLAGFDPYTEQTFVAGRRFQERASGRRATEIQTGTSSGLEEPPALEDLLADVGQPAATR